MLIQRWPLSLRVLCGVGCGIVLGVLGGESPYFFGISNKDLGQLGFLVIRLLKSLAIPLILFAILEAFIRSPITLKCGGRLVAICFVNVTVALTVGLTLINTIQPGFSWHDRPVPLLSQLTGQLPPAPAAPPNAAPSLNFLQNLSGYIPQSLIEPILNNNVISVVLIALLFGPALSWLQERQGETGIADVRSVEHLIAALYQIFVKVLEWVVEIIPFAVCGLVAQAVGKAGISIFLELASFVAIICFGLSIHGLVYYPVVAWLVGGKSPSIYLKQGVDAVLTGFSANSSLAAVPVTLCCLQRMGVSDRMARLSACAGTHLNNDGVTLYEAMAALFLAQAAGFHLDIGQQIVVAFSALMAGVGIVGIPEAGLIVLPLVLSAAGLPEEVVTAMIPLIAAVDWVIARLRSGVNVLSDLLVAILLEAWEKRRPSTTP